MNAVLNFFDRSTALSYEPDEMTETERRWAEFQDWLQGLKQEALCEYLTDFLEQLKYASGRLMSHSKVSAVVEFKGWTEFEYWAFDHRWPGAKA